MNRIAHLVLAAVSLAFAASPLVACSGGVEGETAEATSEALDVSPDADLPCATWSPRDGAGYDPAYVLGNLSIAPIPGFSDELTELGCEPERVFHLGRPPGGDLAVVFCPSAPAVPASVGHFAPGVTTIPVDDCTGATPPGWFVVTWPLHPLAPPAGCRGFQCARI